MDLVLETLENIETPTAGDFINGFIAGAGAVAVGVAVGAGGILLLT